MALKGDLVAKRFEALDQAVLERSLVATIEVVPAEIPVGGPLLEQMVGDDQDGMPHRDGGPLRAGASL